MRSPQDRLHTRVVGRRHQPSGKKGDFWEDWSDQTIQLARNWLSSFLTASEPPPKMLDVNNQRGTPKNRVETSRFLWKSKVLDDAPCETKIPPMTYANRNGRSSRYGRRSQLDWHEIGKKIDPPCASDSVPRSGKRSQLWGSDGISILQSW